MNNYYSLIQKRRVEEEHQHLASVRLPASIDFPKAPSADDPMYAEVVHCQLDIYNIFKTISKQIVT